MIAALLSFFKDTENELLDYHIWADEFFPDILEDDPERE